MLALNVVKQIESIEYELSTSLQVLSEGELDYPELVGFLLGSIARAYVLVHEPELEGEELYRATRELTREVNGDRTRNRYTYVKGKS